MAGRVYNVEEGGVHERFLASRAKVQVFGGGYGNGKTAALCIKALQIAKDYPGANMLLARSTYPKLNDTLRKEFFKWLDPSWKKSFNKAENTLELVNGTTVNFRYVAQQGKTQEQSTSNLLSATYDFIGVDQIEDPEVSHKDFIDLLGRLRGSAQYTGNDPSMPGTGPRWFALTTNPTQNWVYKKLVRPTHRWLKHRVKDPDLIVHPRTGEPIIELFEASTYENARNLTPDFIETLEAAYTGEMRERFLLGKWGSFSGLVYPRFDEVTHCVEHSEAIDYLKALRRQRVKVQILEGFDYGIAAPSCYLLSYVDDEGNVIVLDGLYAAEMNIEDISKQMQQLRNEYNVPMGNDVYADPAIFKRTVGDRRSVGKTVASIYAGEGISMVRGNNDIISGVNKIRSLLEPQRFHTHPLHGMAPAPFLYFSTKVSFVFNEINEYHWSTNSQGDKVDRPVDRNDHAMDTLKYMLSDVPEPSTVMYSKDEPPAWMRWQEYDVQERSEARYR